MRPISEWRREGNCHGKGVLENKEILKHCEAGCPVSSECYLFAVAHRESGIWGGTRENQRTVSALGVDYINAIRQVFRELKILENREHLLADQELRAGRQPVLYDPTAHSKVCLESSPDQYLAEPA